MTTKNQNSGYRSAKQSDDLLSKYISERVDQEQVERNKPENGNKAGKFIRVAVIVLLGFFLLRAASNISIFPNSPVFNSALISSGPSEDLLNRMGSLMTEMGYANLSHDELRQLRSEGVTATYVSNIRALGFTDLTLDEAVSLSNAGARPTFIAMMIELGYTDLTIADFIQMRRAGVTAHYTSNVHDLGYADVTPEQLIRMRQIGLSTSLIERLQQERGQDIGLDEIIRYRISNQ